MHEIRSLGTRFALDDFGTGYSSLSYLQRFPVDVLKVDKAFIDALNDRDGGSLVRAIIHMGESLRMRVVAEGIEDPAQAAFLCRTGCDLANDTVARLAELPNVAGIKDATGDLVRHVDLVRRLRARRDFRFYSGNDDTALAYMLLGGHGVISVSANVAPRAVAEVCKAALAGDVGRYYEGHHLVAVLPIELPCRMDAFGLITRTDRPLSPAARVMLAAVKAAAAESYGVTLEAGV